MKTALLLATVYLALLAVAAELKEDTLLNWKRGGNDDKKSDESDEKGNDDKSEKSLEWWNKKGDSKEESVSLIDGSPEKEGVIDLKDGKEKDKGVWVLKDDKSHILPIDKLPVDVDIQDVLDWRNDKRRIFWKLIKEEIQKIDELTKDEEIDGAWDLKKGKDVLLPKGGIEIDDILEWKNDKDIWILKDDKGRIPPIDKLPVDVDIQDILDWRNDKRRIFWKLIKEEIQKIDELTKDEEIDGAWDLKKGKDVLLPKGGIEIDDILEWKNDKKEVELKPIKVEISKIDKLWKKDEKIDGVWDLKKGEVILLPKKGTDSHEVLAWKNDQKNIDWQLIKLKIPKIDKLTKKDEEIGGVWDLKKEVILLPKKGTDVHDILDWKSDKKSINWLPIKVIIPKIDELTKKNEEVDDVWDLKNGKVSSLIWPLKGKNDENEKQDGKEILSDELKLHNVQRRDTRQIWDLKYGKGYEGIDEGVWKHGKGNPGDVEHEKKDKEIRKLREWEKKQEKKIWDDHWKSKDWKKEKDLRNSWYGKEKRRKPWNADWI